MAGSDHAFLPYLLQDDLYLLNQDKAYYATPAPQQSPPVAEQISQQLQPAIEETPQPTFNCLGGNGKRFLILVHYPAHEHMDAAHLKALENTLSRKELSIVDVAILNVATIPPAHHTCIINFYNPIKVLILGEAALIAELQPQLNVILKGGAMQQLYSHSFNEMLADREKAKAFWEQMKNF